MDTITADFLPESQSLRSTKPTLKALKAAIESGQPASWLDVEVTPAMASLMLQYNKVGETNRSLSPSYINAQEITIRAGNWLNTGEPIIFSNEAILNDGQHRLKAIIATGETVTADIRFGVARRAFIATNTGHPRTAAQALHIAGFATSAMTGAVCRLIHQYRIGLPRSNKERVSNVVIVEMVEQDPRIEQACQISSNFGRYIKNAAVGATIYFGLCTANQAAVEEFAYVLKTGEGNVSNPPHRLREALIKQAAGGYSTEGRVRTLAWGIQAMNAFRKGKAVGRYLWKYGDPFPVVDGYKPD